MSAALALCRLLVLAILLSFQEQQTPIVGPPSIDGVIVSQVFAGSPLAPYATDVYRLGAEANIDPAFALAIWRKESEFGTTGAATTTRNVGNLVCDAAQHPPATGCHGRWAVYPDYPSMIRDWYAYIQRRYVDQGLTTVESILPVYAPPSENNTQQYIGQVKGWMRDWGSGSVETVPPDQTGGFLENLMPDDWINRPIDELKYAFWHGLAALIWSFNQGVLALADLLDSFRRLLTSAGFRPVVDSLAAGMLGISRSVFTVGLTLVCLFLILSPLGRMIQLINSRKLLGLIVLTPALLGAGVAGAFFQDLEQLRGDIGSLLHQGAMEQVGPAFASMAETDTGTGRAQTMCEVVPYNPQASQARNGAAIAAAFLCATRGDVLDPANPAPDDLPDEFAATYFRLSPAQFAAADDADREAQISDAITGVGRMLTGITLVVFALVEAATTLLWTLGLGILVLAGVLVWIFSWFRPYEHMLTVLSYRILQVFTSSWVLSAIYGVVLAANLAIADSRNATLVFAAGLGTLFLGLWMLWIAGSTVAGALSSAWDAMVGGGGARLSGGVRWAEQRMRQGAMFAGGAAGATYGAATGVTTKLAGGYQGAKAQAGDLTETLMAYGMAHDAGNSRRYAATYAATRYRPLARIGALANAMDLATPDVERALFAGHAAHGDHFSPAAVRRVRRDGTAAKRQQLQPPPPSPSPVSVHAGQGQPPQGGNP